MSADTAKKLVIRLHTLQDDERPVYLSGNFNDWRTAEARYRMARQGDGHYEYTFDEPAQLPTTLEYKFTKGGWDDVELDRFGNLSKNHHTRKRSGVLQHEVPRWRRHGRSYQPHLLPQIRVISEHFEMPQLGRYRRVAALLPHDYAHSGRRYPVIYLQDGQNLADEHAPYGNWGVDKRLAVLAEMGMGDLIVVAIDHGGKERIHEFTPFEDTHFGIGQGRKYVHFIADTLKPYVDRHFRTLDDRHNTCVGGSSMGGLISVYAGLMRPDIFGKLMIFSPSLWLIPDMRFGSIGFERLYPTRIYLYGGQKESRYMIPSIRRLKERLDRSNHDSSIIQTRLSIDPDGVHNEEHWGNEFPKAVEWLFFE